MIASALFPIAFYAAAACGVPAPRTPAAHLEAGQCFARVEKWKDAEHHLRIYLRGNLQSERATVLHSRALVHLGQPFDAVLEVEAFLKAKPDSAPVLKVYAALQEKVVRDIRKTDEILEKLTKLTPEDAEVWRTLGTHYLTQELPDRALECYRQAARLAPADPIAAAGYGVALGKAHREAEASAQIAKALTLNERRAKPMPLVYLVCAQYFFEENRPPDSLAMAAKALALDAHSVMGYYWRAASYERLGDLRHAEGDALAALREGANDYRQVHALLMRIYRAQGRTEAAEREAAELARISAVENGAHEQARSVRELLKQAEPMLRQGKYAEAVPLYEQIAKDLPTFYEAHFALGVCYSQTSRPVEAEASFRRYLRLQPLSGDGHAALGVLLANLNRTAEATKELEQALHLDAGQIDARRVLGDIYMASSQYARAAEVLQAGAASPDADSGYRVALAQALLRSGDKKGALELLDRLLAAEPANAAAAELKRQAEIR